MAGGFGFSISNLKLLATFVSKVHQALKEEGGSASEYHQATTTLQSLQITLEQIDYSLHTGNPSFRHAVRSQLESQRLFIAEFNERLLEQYGDKLGGSTSASRTHGALCKVKWAFAATEDLRTFWMELLRRLEIVKLLMSSEIRTEVAGVSSSLQELRVLMSEVFQGQTIVEDAGQYLRVQEHIDNLRQEVREVRRDAVAPLPETPRGSQPTSFKSRHHATRIVVRVVDSTGAILETRSDVFCPIS